VTPRGLDRKGGRGADEEVEDDAAATPVIDVLAEEFPLSVPLLLGIETSADRTAHLAANRSVLTLSSVY
jgi:hypothetical protein